MIDSTTVDRIIAKIDNDFNPSNSDWIPRVGAWVYDALMQLDCVQTETKRKRLTVINNIARSDCNLGKKIKVFDANGCPIDELDYNNHKCCGEKPEASHSSMGVCLITPKTVEKAINPSKQLGENIAVTINGPYPERYNVIPLDSSVQCKKGYIVIDDKTLELNFDTDFIYVEYESVLEVHCDVYGCNAPAIPNNGKLIEAITYYCIYKMLTRGYKHPVMNLAASQYGTNPYYIWLQSKEEAKRSVINDGIDENIDDLWRSAFYINTFNPRGKS